MNQDIENAVKVLRDQFYNDISKEIDVKQILEVKSFYLGPKSLLIKMLKELKDCPMEERKARSKLLNDLQTEFHQKVTELHQVCTDMENNKNLQGEFINLTQLINTDAVYGCLHPLTKTMQEMFHWFRVRGFSLQDGPEIETGYYNFTALNVPPHHSARDAQDTFYLKNLASLVTHDDPHVSYKARDFLKDDSVESCLDDKSFILRTQTSPVQIRAMEAYGAPLRIFSMGRTCRSDAMDATHSPTFHQCEGLCIDKGVNMGHLKGLLSEFFSWFFQDNMKIRFRPNFFPFTTMSTEVDIVSETIYQDAVARGVDIPWLEVMGCGMVHPQVLRNVNIDPEIYQGFAWGMGIERLVMIKKKIEDIRLFYRNNVLNLKLVA